MKALNILAIVLAATGLMFIPLSRADAAIQWETRIPLDFNYVIEATGAPSRHARRPVGRSPCGPSRCTPGCPSR